MEQMKIEFYSLILKMALEYRLSLENLCIILGMESIEENRENLYEIFENLFSKNNDLKVLYDFLFKCETLNEEEETSLEALNSGYLFFNKYKIANRNRDNQMLDELMNELNCLDNKINIIKNRDVTKELTDDDYSDIFKFKLKYCLSRAELSKILNISGADLIRKELQLTDKKMRKKLNILNKNQFDIVFSRSSEYDVENVLNISFDNYDDKLMEMCK